MDIVRLFHRETGQAMEFADGAGAHAFLHSVEDAGKWVAAEGRQVLEALMGEPGDAADDAADVAAAPVNEAQAVADEAVPSAAAVAVSTSAAGA